MIPERPRVRNEGDRQELMAEELAGFELEGEELELGRERRRPARPLPPEEIPERAAPAVETSEGSTFGVETGDVGIVTRRSSEGGGHRRGRSRRSARTAATAGARRGRRAGAGGRRRTALEKRSSHRTKEALR